MTMINGIELDLDKVSSDLSRGLCVECKVNRGTKNLNDKCPKCAYPSR